MRILHTSDWHLGSKLYSYDRTDELFRQVEEICRLTVAHKVDVLLVAGDIFERRTSQLPELTKRLTDILTPYVRDGLHVVLVPGNHDHRDHFRMMRALLSMEQGHSDRVHIVQTREIFTISGVQFAAIPYPMPELLEPFQVQMTGATQRHLALSTAYANLVRSIVDSIDSSLPAIFIGHVTVAGVTTPSERELTYDDDIRLGRSDLPLAENLAYIALGHIHQCQSIDHPIPCYYSGSIERLNLGERNDEKNILLVDVSGKGPGVVTPIELNTTPFYDLTIKASDLESLPSAYPDIHQAFVRIHIQADGDEDIVAIQRRVRELCPQSLEVDVAGSTSQYAPLSSLAHPKDYAATVFEHIRQQYGQDPDLLELEKIASDLLVEVSDAIAKD